MVVKFFPSLALLGKSYCVIHRDYQRSNHAFIMKRRIQFLQPFEESAHTGTQRRGLIMGDKLIYNCIALRSHSYRHPPLCTTNDGQKRNHSS